MPKPKPQPILPDLPERARKAMETDGRSKKDIAAAIDVSYTAFMQFLQQGIMRSASVRKKIETWLGVDSEPELLSLAKAAAKPVKPPKEPKAKKPSLRETLEAENERLRRENKALKDHQRKEKAYAGEVQACEIELEAANSERSSAKERLAEANKKLANFVRGESPKDIETGKQETFVPEKPKGKTPPLIDPKADGGAAFAQGKSLGANPYQTGTVDFGHWMVGYCQAKWAGLEERKAINYAITGSSLLDLLTHESLPEGSAPKIKAARFLDYHWLVVDGWKAEEKGDLRFVCLQLFKKDDWKDLWQETYGRASDEPETVEARNRRQAGGVDCGRLVRVGRELFVVGPKSAACILVAPSTEAGAKDAPAEQASIPFDAKAAAANDSTNDESVDD